MNRATPAGFKPQRRGLAPLRVHRSEPSSRGRNPEAGLHGRLPASAGGSGTVVRRSQQDRPRGRRRYSPQGAKGAAACCYGGIGEWSAVGLRTMEATRAHGLEVRRRTRPVWREPSCGGLEAGPDEDEGAPRRRDGKSRPETRPREAPRDLTNRGAAVVCRGRGALGASGPGGHQGARRMRGDTLGSAGRRRRFGVAGIGAASSVRRPVRGPCGSCERWTDDRGSPRGPRAESARPERGERRDESSVVLQRRFRFFSTAFMTICAERGGHAPGAVRLLETPRVGA